MDSVKDTKNVKNFYDIAKAWNLLGIRPEKLGIPARVAITSTVLQETPRF